MPNDVIKKLTTIAKFHDHIKFFFRFNNFIELNDVGVPNFLEDFNLSGDSLDIFLIVDLVLF